MDLNWATRISGEVKADHADEEIDDALDDDNYNDDKLFGSSKQATGTMTFLY